MKNRTLKKVLSAALVSAMVLSMAACGSKTAETPASSAPAAESEADVESTAETTAETEEVKEEAAAGDEGADLNIYCWNDEFQRRVKDHYPGYEEVDANNGKIGDVNVHWLVTPSDDNAYQNKLDETLLGMDSASAEDRIDMFLIESDYAPKYIQTEYPMALSDLGITEDDMANQYQYTKDIATDAAGVQRGITWQACPGALFYNREAAKEVLGSDDAETVQAAVADWAKFEETAAAMKAAGYKMTSSTDDLYRAFSDNVSEKWVDDSDKIQIDDNIMAWVDMSKKMVDAGETSTAELWSDDWKKGFYPEGKVFCYFGPAWLINFCMAADDEGSIANQGGWGITEGPQGFSWGGTWICAAEGTDNAGLIADIMKTLCCDEATMTDIVKADDDFVNNKPAMEAMAADESYTSDILGGINPLPVYVAGCDNITRNFMSPYDQACTEEIQNAARDYYNGNTDLDTALDTFKKAVVVKHPNLSY